ncbi:porin [Ferrimonas senticii]|uniref:porin n=1 Tax=Ferrimonas senticii TaxID=394566 RepID=UPI000429275E|nr:porin [Ferrimonas senticii]
MRRLDISIGLFACCASLTAAATTIYDDGANQIKLGGHAGLLLVDGGGDLRLADSSTRINLQFLRPLSAEWQVEAKLEWGFNLVDAGESVTLTGDSIQASREDSFLFNRLGYIAVKHQQYGRFSAGKQWGVYYDVAQYTDNFMVSGGLALGVYNFDTDGGLSGTGRADSAIQYRNSWHGVDIALQYQARTEAEVSVLEPSGCDSATPAVGCDANDDLMVSYDDSYAAAIGYHWQQWYLGSAINYSRIDSSRIGGVTKEQAIVATLAYGQLYQPGFHGALSAAVSEAHELDQNNRLFDAKGAELLLSWTLANGLTLIGGLNSLQSDDSQYEIANGDFKRELYIAGVHYRWQQSLIVFIEGKLDNSEFGFSGEDEENLVAAGVRFYF